MHYAICTQYAICRLPAEKHDAGLEIDMRKPTAPVDIGGRTSSVYVSYIIAVNYMTSGSSDGKEPACNVGDLGLIPGSRRSPGEVNGNPL